MNILSSRHRTKILTENLENVEPIIGSIHLRFDERAVIPGIEREPPQAEDIVASGRSPQPGAHSIFISEPREGLHEAFYMGVILFGKSERIGEGVDGLIQFGFYSLFGIAQLKFKLPL